MAHAVLFHFESRSRERAVHQWETDTIVRRWGMPDRTDMYRPSEAEQTMLRGSGGAVGPQSHVYVNVTCARVYTCGRGWSSGRRPGRSQEFAE